MLILFEILILSHSGLAECVKLSSMIVLIAISGTQIVSVVVEVNFGFPKHHYHTTEPRPSVNCP